MDNVNLTDKQKILFKEEFLRLVEAEYNYNPTITPTSPWASPWSFGGEYFKYDTDDLDLFVSTFFLSIKERLNILIKKEKEDFAIQEDYWIL